MAPTSILIMNWCSSALATLDVIAVEQVGVMDGMTSRARHDERGTGARRGAAVTSVACRERASKQSGWCMGQELSTPTSARRITGRMQRQQRRTMKTSPHPLERPASQRRRLQNREPRSASCQRTHQMHLQREPAPRRAHPLNAQRRQQGIALPALIVLLQKPAQCLSLSSPLPARPMLPLRCSASVRWNPAARERVVRVALQTILRRIARSLFGGLVFARHLSTSSPLLSSPLRRFCSSARTTTSPFIIWPPLLGLPSPPPLCSI